MKRRFDLDAYYRWVAAFALTGTLLLLWALAFIGIVAVFTTIVEPAEAVGAETAVEVPAPAIIGEIVAPTEAPTVEPEPEIDPELLEQLAIVIYREAGGDAACDDCRVRVADVALNRVADERFPDTLEGVLTQKSQYGTMHWDGIVWPARADNPGEAHAVERAYRVAEEVLAHNHSELYGQGYIFQSEFPNLGTEAVECCGIYYAKG